MSRIKNADVLPYSIGPDGTLTITVPKDAQVGRVLVQEDGTQWGGLFYPDSVPVFRCRDCRHYEWTKNRIPEEQTWVCRHWNEETGKDDFCSYGERKE